MNDLIVLKVLETKIYHRLHEILAKKCGTNLNILKANDNF
jgi:hypothetical protein